MTERINQACESIKEAELLYGERIGNKIVLAKLYHSMMYCLFALFDIRDIGSLTHADIIERFEKECIQKGIFESKLLAVIHHAYDLTHECDCAHMPVPADEDIELTMQAAKEFVNRVNDYLQTERQESVRRL